MSLWRRNSSQHTRPMGIPGAQTRTSEEGVTTVKPRSRVVVLGKDTAARLGLQRAFVYGFVAKPSEDVIAFDTDSGRLTREGHPSVVINPEAPVKIIRDGETNLVSIGDQHNFDLGSGNLLVVSREAGARVHKNSLPGRILSEDYDGSRRMEIK